MGALRTILKDNWDWRGRVFQLARFELVKKVRGSVLSWAWLIIRPLVYIACFWFALEIGLKAGRGIGGDGAPPFILWLSAGILPWFFMADIIGGGSNVFSRYSYLVNKIKFPLSCIPPIYVEASFGVHLVLIVVLFVIYFCCGQLPDIYLLQIPIILILLSVYWTMFSLALSILTAYSKDIHNLIKALRTPIFWLSGAIFNVKDVPIDWLQTVLYFDPVTFFVTAYRCAFFDKTWFWEDPVLCGGFAVVFLLTFLLMVIVYRHLHEGVADVV